MEKKDLRIVFMGTPEFAVESLKSLVEGGYNVVAVVTQPDKPVGRHQDTLQAPPVKQYALEQGLPVLQPVKMKDPEFVEQLRGFRADLQVVVAFRMLPEVVWAMPRFGTLMCMPPCCLSIVAQRLSTGLSSMARRRLVSPPSSSITTSTPDASSCRSLSLFPTMPMWSMSTTD